MSVPFMHGSCHKKGEAIASPAYLHKEFKLNGLTDAIAQ
jgi:hypothetical protein